jgi:hypothetical protein
LLFFCSEGKKMFGLAWHVAKELRQGAVFAENQRLGMGRGEAIAYIP